MIKSFENEDPPKQKQKAISSLFLRDMRAFAMKGPRWTRVAADLIIGAFFFAMRACEFCQVQNERVTEQVTLGDIVFRDDRNAIVPQGDGDLEGKSNFVTIRFANQKNRSRNERRTLKRTGCEILCPVRAWARTVARLRAESVEPLSDSTTISSYIIQGEVYEVRSDQVLQLLRLSCDANDGANRYGIRSDELGTRSIRAGAAMALALGEDGTEKEIRRLGRWKSNSFMDYIRPQVLEFAGDTAKTMIQTSSFRDLGEYSPRRKRSSPNHPKGRPNTHTK